MSVSLDAHASTNLTPYAPRLLLQWEQDEPDTLHRSIEGTLVFADVSGFTRLSERLARLGGKSGAEDMAEIIGGLFGDLLTVAARRGGEMLKYGGDAVLLFFRGPGHAPRAAAGALEMQRRLHEIGRVDTASGAIRLRMSVGMHSGDFDLFKVGGSHKELVIAGPATTETVRMESAADAREVLLSAATAARLDERVLGAEKEGGRLLRRLPDAETVAIVPSVPSEVADLFLAPSLRAHLASTAMEPEHRLATVAFIHAMGMDSLLEEHGPRVVADWLHDTMCVIQDACTEFDVSFLATDLSADGTKVMAASGAPSAGHDDEARMLLALRKIVTADTPLPIRAGCHRGHVFAAAVGPPYRKTYTTLGDVTNTAARVMGKAQAGEVLTLRPVLDAAKVRFETEELPPFMAKGKAVPLVPYRVLGLAPEMPQPPATRLPLTGRDAEIAQLRAAFESARAGAGQLVEVVGDMGSGKTRLLTEALTEGHDLESIVVHCEPYHRSSPFHPIRLLLQRLLVADAADTAAALSSAVEALAPELGPWVPLLAGVLDLDVPDTEETRVLEARFRLQKTAEVTFELLRAKLVTPALLVVEDVHWLDDASAVILRHLEAEVGTTPWAVVVTRRNEPATFVPTRSGSTTLHLPPLSDDDMVALVRAATADSPIPPHQQEAIVGRAAGNPLFLTELLGTGTDGEALPDSIEAVMAAQIDRLPPADRRLLRHAAVLGSRFDLKLLAELSEEPHLAMAGARALTSRLQWLVVPEGRGQLRFRHQLIRDVAYEGLPFRQRRALHARAGDVIEATFSTDESAGILSLHFLRAGRDELCWRYARIAADRAAAKYANVETVELLERALGAARSLPYLPEEEISLAWRTLGDRQALIGNLQAARTSYQRARRLARQRPAEFARLCLKEARTAERTGKVAATYRWLRRGLAALNDLSGDAEASARADLLVMIAFGKVNQGHPRRARPWAERAAIEAERSGNKTATAYSYMLLNNIDAALGKPVDAARAEAAIAMFDDIGLLGEQAIVLMNSGTDAYLQGRWDDALRLFERSRDAMKRVGNVIEAGYGTLNIAEILLDQGHLDDAESSLLDLAPLWQSVDHVLGLAFIDSHRARIRIHRNMADEAIELITSARQVFDGYGLVTESLDAEARLAECLLRLGRLDDARQAVLEAARRDRAAGGTRVAPRLQRLLAFCCAASDDLEGAWSAMDESLHLARRSLAVYDVALALEGFEILAAMGGPSVDPDVIIERQRLLGELGVIATPAPPIAIPTA